jgi:hypothetical protein
MEILSGPLSPSEMEIIIQILNTGVILYFVRRFINSSDKKFAELFNRLTEVEKFGCVACITEANQKRRKEDNKA